MYKNQIKDHYAFVTFLLGLYKFNKSNLTILNSHGIHYAKLFKKKIASYIDIPFGKQWSEIIKVAIIYKIIL